MPLESLRLPLGEQLTRGTQYTLHQPVRQKLQEYYRPSRRIGIGLNRLIVSLTEKYKGGSPAAVTGAKESFSRAPRKAIRKGTRRMSLIAFNALFDVSLQM